MDNSLYGLPQGSAYSLKGDNTYQSLPAILDQKQGYTSNVMHGTTKHFGIEIKFINISVLTISMMLLTMTCLTTILLILV